MLEFKFEKIDKDIYIVTLLGREKSKKLGYLMLKNELEGEFRFNTNKESSFECKGFKASGLKVTAKGSCETHLKQIIRLLA